MFSSSGTAIMRAMESKRFSLAILACVIIVVILYKHLTNEPNSEMDSQTKSTKMTLNELSGREEFDELLLAYARDVMIEPSSRDVPYFLDGTNNKDHSGLNYTQIFTTLLKNKTNGFFVDCGSFDGEHGSVSMSFEADHNWSGLLVDASPMSLQKILLKSRKAWFAPTCMSPERKSMMVSFEEQGMQSHITKDEKKATGPVVRSLCLPFHTLMKALGVSKVDLFNLDVEGNELPILKTIDFNLVQIDAMTIEHYNNNENDRNEIKRIMQENGFKFLGQNGFDFMFIHSRV
ncbi:protein Star-like [Cloeon dipterum]|uniref:protein Star-like n=1 Tax=Cloeon dipterum TaxID=197152 RepID=UPI00321FA617